MAGKFTFCNIIELKDLSPLAENSAHKKMRHQRDSWFKIFQSVHLTIYHPSLGSV